ncbi:DEAD/DEAH box helicase [Treponema socranskii]|uniref:DEAD/DEAH box helicase n=1 Tax=Treponema socranskii TaxID=53419 RepID=UPI0028ECCA51|nr:DEAD/DEAH box helicase [Treponema socranskii]
MDSEDISFEDLGLDEQTLAAVARKGFVTPSPIQVLAIPRLLDGDANVIARARTGTGKTAAFGLPLVQRLRGGSDHVKALILEPTRELAVQTCTEMQSFADGKFPRTCVVYGGASMLSQIRDLKRGVEIVVGTPGRIQDHIERGTLDIGKIDYFILDEGDEMLDMGFIEDIEAIFEKANPASRILLFSATMPAPILKIASQFMGEYEIVEEEGVVDEPLLIEQKFWVLRESEKIDALVRLIDISDDFYGLVFTQTKMDADTVARQLDERGYEVAALHGDVAQSQREKILARFRRKKTRILVATDVAARGIDITGLSHVVNYSLPFDGATYVHRIGRTGRAGAAGTAITFVRPEERKRKLSYMQNAIRKSTKGELKEEAVPTIEEVVAKKRERLFDKLKSDIGLSSRHDRVSESDDADKLIINNSDAQSDISASNDESDMYGVPDAEGQNDVSVEAAASDANAKDDTEVQSDADMRGDTNLQKPALIKADAQFAEMAKELCKDNDAEDVLAAVMSVLYGTSLDVSRYGKIARQKGEAGRNRVSFGGAGDQVRLYVQMGRRDGYGPREIADYFSDLLHIPGRFVDRIDMAANFTLLSLPADSAKKALELSKRGGDVPHIHVDSKSGGFEKKTRSSFRGDGESFGGKKKSGRFERSGGFGEKKFRAHGRPNVHTPTERSGSAGLYRRKSSGRAERF